MFLIIIKIICYNKTKNKFNKFKIHKILTNFIKTNLSKIKIKNWYKMIINKTKIILIS